MKRISLTAWILIALVGGIAFGAAFPEMAPQDSISKPKRRIPWRL